MSHKVIVDETDVGQGVFASQMIKPGELIFYLNGKMIDFEQSKGFQGEYSVQVGIGRYVDPIAPGRFLNHSCEPNSGFSDSFSLVALRQIDRGEEIRFDYSTTMFERFWELDCQCGSTRCRRRIRDFDLLPESLRNKYFNLGIVPEFILEELGVPALQRITKFAA
ncbi:MAG: SET domain-containing protein-lysine N-methyltransferase [Verrucomicrobiae bacterium]|nr:SET domain-containing protein-lysine N-methyltransferase [Verrucomicrobiae bacterium]